MEKEKEEEEEEIIITPRRKAKIISREEEEEEKKRKRKEEEEEKRKPKEEEEELIDIYELKATHLPKLFQSTLLKRERIEGERRKRRSIFDEIRFLANRLFQQMFRTPSENLQDSFDDNSRKFLFGILIQLMPPDVQDIKIEKIYNPEFISEVFNFKDYKTKFETQFLRPYREFFAIDDIWKNINEFAKSFLFHRGFVWPDKMTLRDFDTIALMYLMKYCHDKASLILLKYGNFSPLHPIAIVLVQDAIVQFLYELSHTLTTSPKLQNELLIKISFTKNLSVDVFENYLKHKRKPSLLFMETNIFELIRNNLSRFERLYITFVEYLSYRYRFSPEILRIFIQSNIKPNIVRNYVKNRFMAMFYIYLNRRADYHIVTKTMWNMGKEVKFYFKKEHPYESKFEIPYRSIINTVLRHIKELNITFLSSEFFISIPFLRDSMCLVILEHMIKNYWEDTQFPPNSGLTEMELLLKDSILEYLFHQLSTVSINQVDYSQMYLNDFYTKTTLPLSKFKLDSTLHSLSEEMYLVSINDDENNEKLPLYHIEKGNSNDRFCNHEFSLPIILQWMVDKEKNQCICPKC